MASKAVNRPVNEKLKEQDLNNKLQLYGIYSGSSLGPAISPVPHTDVTASQPLLAAKFLP